MEFFRKFIRFGSPKDEKFAEKFLQRIICQKRFILSENAKDANIAGQLLGTG